MMPSAKSSSKPKPPAKHVSFEAIGTSWTIQFWSNQVDSKNLLQQIQQRAELFDKAYSRFRNDSLITKMSKRGGTYELPDDADELIKLYRAMYDLTDGRVTPLIGQTLAQAGYDSEYSLRPGKLTKLPAWDEAMVYKSDTHELTTKMPILLDFGAAGKGYLVDIITELIKQQGVDRFLVNGGGDIRYIDSKAQPIKIGLENPDNTEQMIGIAQLANQSLCGSAGNRRRWANFHHIIDPYTLASPEDIKAVWVVADKAIVADGLTTCLYFVEPEELQQQFSFEYLIITSDNSVQRSLHFPAELFTS